MYIYMKYFTFTFTCTFTVILTWGIYIHIYIYIYMKCLHLHLHEVSTFHIYMRCLHEVFTWSIYIYIHILHAHLHLHYTFNLSMYIYIYMKYLHVTFTSTSSESLYMYMKALHTGGITEGLLRYFADTMGYSCSWHSIFWDGIPAKRFWVRSEMLSILYICWCSSLKPSILHGLQICCIICSSSVEKHAESFRSGRSRLEVVRIDQNPYDSLRGGINLHI